MPERNHEVVIDGYVFPDTVTVTLANDEYVNSRDYVSKELYESVFDANDAWQSENAKLRELVRDMMGFFEDGDWCVKCERTRDCQAQEQYEDDCLMRFVFRDRMRELGVLHAKE